MGKNKLTEKGAEDQQFYCMQAYITTTIVPGYREYIRGIHTHIGLIKTHIVWARGYTQHVNINGLAYM